MLFDFTGKTLMVTGAGSGIGKATAELFHAAGASLVIADIATEPLTALANKLDPTGRSVKPIAGDVTNVEHSKSLVEVAKKHFGGIDYLVPAAGIYPRAKLSEISDEVWRRMMAINLDGVFYVTRAAVPIMRAGGAIVNLSSMAGHRGSFNNAHYASTKGALLSFTRSLALELAPDIRVNAVAPGLIETPTVVKVMEPERKKKLLEQTPLARFGRAEEIAAVIAYLCSPAASYVTGESINANGGLFISG